MYKYIYVEYMIVEIDTEGMEDTTTRRIAILRDDNYIDIDSQIHHFFMLLLPDEPVHNHAMCDWYDWFGGTYIIDILITEGITEEQYEFLAGLHVISHTPVIQPL